MIGQWNYDDGDGHTITIPPQFRQYLCYMCPFQQTYIQVELRRRRGMYKEGLTPLPGAARPSRTTSVRGRRHM